jgi:hypothetical protein
LRPAQPACDERRRHVTNGAAVLAQPWLAYRAIQVFQHRYARSLFTSQPELWPSSANRL